MTNLCLPDYERHHNTPLPGEGKRMRSYRGEFEDRSPENLYSIESTSSVHGVLRTYEDEMYEYMYNIREHDKCGVFNVPVPMEMYGTSARIAGVNGDRDITYTQPSTAKLAIAINDIGVFLASFVMLEENPYNNGFDPLPNYSTLLWQLPQKRHLHIECYACHCDKRVEQIRNLVDGDTVEITQYMAERECKITASMTECRVRASPNPDIDEIKMFFECGEMPLPIRCMLGTR